MSTIKFWFQFLCCMLMVVFFLTAIVCGFLFLLSVLCGCACFDLLWKAVGGLATFLFLMWLGEVLKFPGTEHLRE